MTREKIIQGLQFTIDMFLSDPLTGEALEKPRNDMDKTTIDACKGAIELLEQQPCYNPDEWCHNCSEYNHDKHCCPRFNKVIRNTVEEIKETNIRTAEWVLLDECSNSGYYCSYCHKKLVKEGWSDTVKKIKFCPNCGARMVESQESEKLNGTH